MLSRPEEAQEEEHTENVGIVKIARPNSTTTLQNMNSTVSLSSEKSRTEEQRNQAEEERELLKELEASSKGIVKGSLVSNYLKSAKRPFTLVFLVVSFLMSQILASVADIWVSYW